MNKYKVLIVDKENTDFPSLAKSWSVQLVHKTAQELPIYLSSERPDLLILDYNEDNNQVLLDVRKTYPGLRIITLGRGATASDAVRALKLGSVEFVTQDIAAPELRQVVWSLLEESKQKECIVKHPWYFGRSKPLHQLFEDIIKHGRFENIILQGPCGTGKSKVAEIINDTFANKHKRLMAINLSAFPEENREIYFWNTLKDLFKKYESDVVGLEETDHETLYLEGLEGCTPDFITTLFELLLNRQTKDMVSKQVKIIVGLTDIKSLGVPSASLGEFSLIQVPSLKDRAADIPEILKSLVDTYNKKFAKSLEGISFEVLNLLLNYSWPGNLRELDSLVESMILICSSGPVLNVSALPLTIQMLEDSVYQPGYNSVLPVYEAKEIFEKKLIEFTTEKFGLEKAANLLNIHSKVVGIKQ